MKHTRKDLSESKIEFNVVVASEDVAKHHQSAVKRLSKDIKVSGFRAGHVPAEVAEKHIDPAKLADEAINSAINAALIEIIEGEQIQLLDQPKIEIDKFVPAQTLEFKATVEIVPPVKLADITKLKAKKDLVKVEDADVESALKQLRGNVATTESVKREAKIDDDVVINFDGRDKDDKDVEGAKGEDYTLKLGSKTFIPGFEDGLVGHKAGDKFDLPLTFPKDYGAKQLAGAKVNFKVEIKDVKEVKLPELDDAFVKIVAPDLKTVDDLKADIRKEITARTEYDVTEKFKNDLIDELTEKSKVSAPEVLVEDQLEALEQNFTQNLMYRGQTLEQYLDSQNLSREDWIKKELRPAAEKRVRNSMVMAQLTRDWDISVTDQEVADRQAKIVAQYNDPALIQRFESDEAKRQIAQQLMADKTLNKLAELNSK